LRTSAGGEAIAQLGSGKGEATAPDISGELDDGKTNSHEYKKII